MSDIILPALGEGVSKATVVCWHAPIGAAVKMGDEIVEVVTDKATFSVEAPADGKLKSIMVSEGKDAPVGGVLGTIE